MEQDDSIDIYSQFDFEKNTNSELIKEFCIVTENDECRQDIMFLIESNKRRRLAYLVKNNQWSYFPKLCDYTGKCKNGIDCGFAHSKLEQMYHPLNFKIKKCANEVRPGDTYCSKSGKSCTFYHSDLDKREPGIQKRPFDLKTYKVFKCLLVGCDENCTGYHDITERRRDPSKFCYSEVPCINVRPGTEFLTKKCENGDNCEMAHTKNEVYYHENTYQKLQCLRINCELKHCAFKHVTEETTVESKLPAQFSEHNVEHLEGFMNQGSRRSSEKDINSRSSVISKVEEIKLEDSMLEHLEPEESRTNYSIYNCKSCQSSEITYMFSICGALLCLSCLTKECYLCKQVHLKKVSF